jgi:hypothetical protein
MNDYVHMFNILNDEAGNTKTPTAKLIGDFQFKPELHT